MTPALTVIVPVLDEEALLPALLNRLVHHAVQVVVVDGGSRDRTCQVAREISGIQVIQGTAPRASQMNQGAAAAEGQVLMFLHADGMPPAGFPDLIHQALEDPQVAGGAFSLALDDAGLRARLVSRGANLRTWITGHPYGDQALFVRRSVFQEMRGFRPWPYLEDLDFVRRLQQQGRLRILSEVVTVSARRWQAQGYLRTTWHNTILATWLYLGLDAARFARWRAQHRDP
jgi:rSAM/selenodomain-associated transferase 2